MSLRNFISVFVSICGVFWLILIIMKKWIEKSVKSSFPEIIWLFFCSYINSKMIFGTKCQWGRIVNIHKQPAPKLEYFVI